MVLTTAVRAGVDKIFNNYVKVHGFITKIRLPCSGLLF